MKQGRTYSDVAVYLPIEDQWMKGELPEELKKPSAKFHWELHYLQPPAELYGYQPLWVSEQFLSRAKFDSGLLRCGEAGFTSLYVDCEWLDSSALSEILRLARAGLPVCLKRLPASPGRDAKGERRTAFGGLLRELASLPNVSDEWQRVTKKPPLVSGEDAPDFWCRVVGKELLLFFGHPKSRGLVYPMRYGQASEAGPEQRRVRLNIGGKTRDLELRFKPNQSILLRISRTGAVEPLDITYAPAVG